MYQHSGGDFPLSSLTMTTSRGQIILLSSTGKIRCVHVLRKDISSSSLDSAGMCMCNIDSRFNSNFFLEFPTVSNSFMLHFDRKTNFRKGLPDFGVMPSARWWHLAPEFPVARCCVPGDMKGGQVGQGCTTCCSVAAGLRENGEKFILGRIRCEKAPQVVPAWSAVKECLFQVTSALVSDLSKTLCLCVPVIPIYNRKVQVDNLLLDQPYSRLLEDLATNSYLHNL